MTIEAIPAGTPDQRCRAWMNAHLGLITNRIAGAAGLSEGAISRRVSRGNWIRLLPRVYADSTRARGWHEMALAAQLWSEPWGTLCGESAAHVAQILPDEPGDIDIALPTARKPPHPLIRLRRESIAPADQAWLDPFRITSASRTLLDLAAVLSPRHLETALDLVLRRGLATVPRLRWTLGRVGTRGRRGAQLLSELIEARAGDRGRTESHLEDLVARIVRRGDLPPPQAQVLFPGVGRVDFFWPDANLIVESDGFEFHQDRPAFEKDRRRWNELMARGYTLLIVTYELAVREPQRVLEMIREALSRPPSRPHSRSPEAT